MAQSGITVPAPLVDVTWLQAHLGNADLVVVDCRFALNDPQQGRDAYESGHIPGAFYLDLNRDLSSPVQRHGGRHPLPDLTPFVHTLAALGISSNPETAVVAYDATKGAFASRLWWLLRYLGHHNVAVLNGGFPAWEVAQLPVERQIPAPPRTGHFTPDLQSDWVVDRDYVARHVGEAGTVVVDARSPERYRGEQEPIDPIAGAIPGAENFFWQRNLDENGYFLAPPDLAAKWATIPQADNTVFYCGSGVTACVNAFSQAMLGKPMPKIYVGGWSDWCSYQL